MDRLLVLQPNMDFELQEGCNVWMFLLETASPFELTSCCLFYFCCFSCFFILASLLP